MPDSFTLSSILIDVFAIIGVVVYAWKRGRRGLCEIASELLAFAVSLFLALVLYHLLIPPILLLGLSRALAVPLAFLSLWFVLDFLTSGVILSAGRRLAIRCRSVAVDRVFGYLFSLVDGVVFISIVVVAVWSMPLHPDARAKLVRSRVAGSLIRVVAETDRRAAGFFGGWESLMFVTDRDDQETVLLNFTAEKFSIDRVLEEEMLWQINAARASEWLPPLRLDERLAEAARAHAADMLRRGYLSHMTPEGLSPADRAAAVGAEFFLLAENLAVTRDLDSAFLGLMASFRHRANILSPAVTRVGIGVLDAGLNGRVFVQLFAD